MTTTKLITLLLGARENPDKEGRVISRWILAKSVVYIYRSVAYLTTLYTN